MNMPWKRGRDGSSSAQPLARLRDEMESIFDRFVSEPWAGLTGGQRGVFPRVDMCEKENEVCIRADLPGMKPEDVRIEVSNGVLMISGEKNEERSNEDGGYHYSEREFGSFSRTIQLPAGVDEQNVDATYENGV